MSDAKSNAKKLSRPRRRRWRGVALLFVVALLAGAWFAPEIVARTALRHRAANWLLSGLPLRAEIGSASLSWFAAVVARDVRVWGDDGELAMTVAELRTDRTLWRLVTDRASLGTITLRDSTINVRLRDGGSNFEDVVAVWNSLPTSEPVPSVRVEFLNARIGFDHVDANRTATLESLDVKFASGAAGLDFFAAELPSRTASTTATDAGRFAVYFGRPGAWETTAAPKQEHSDSPEFLFRAKDWRLDWLSPVLARWQPQGELAGTLTADIRVQNEPINAGASGNEDAATALQTKLSLRVQNLLIAGINGMKSDRLELDEVSLRGNAAVLDDRVFLEEVELAAEPGSLTATGEFPLSGWSVASVGDTLRKLGQQSFRVQGDLDLARIAELLPQTLAVRQGTRIDGGSVRVALSSQPEDGRERVQANFVVAGLSALSGGQRFDWPEPLQASLAAHHEGDEFVFDQVSCRSDFLQADAKGTLTDATFSARADLDRLHRQLNRFFDWGIVRLSGQVVASGHVQRSNTGDVELRSKAELTNFELQRRGESPWREERLEIVASSTAQLSEQQQLRSVESASMRLVSGADRLDLKLQEPVAWSEANPHWRAVAELSGGLDSWQARLRPVLSVEGWQVAGQIAAQAELNSDARGIDLAKLSLGIDNLLARGPEWLIQEPKLTLETVGRWESATSRWLAPRTVLVGTSAAATIDDFTWTLAGGNAGANGEAQFRVHLGNVSRWKVAAQREPSLFVSGEATGSLRLQQGGSTTQAMLDGRIEQLAVATAAPRTQSGWETAWQEPEVTLATQASFDAVKQSLRLSDARLTADGLQLNLAGEVADLEATPQVDVSGEIACDWERLTLRLGESLRRHVQLTGRERRKFALRGRLSSLELANGHAASTRAADINARPVSTASSTSALGSWTGEAGLGWQSANLFGLSAGAGDVSCQLTDGVGSLRLRDLPVNGGTVRLNSQLRFDRVPAVAVLQSDRVIDKVRLSPELCASWFKFVAPMLADVTRADGLFSVVLANGTMPVLDPSVSEVSGDLAIHSAQLSPGPLANQIIAIIDRAKTLTNARSLKPADLLSLIEPNTAAGQATKDRVWMTLPEQQVPFRVTGGRVHHDRLTMITKEATLISRGSVGFDESLDLVIEIPVLDDWIAARRELASLRGKSLSVPVRGSLRRPMLDPRALESLARESLSKPVENLLENELQKGLNKLLPRPKK
jgi:hypothetical protein